MNHHLEPLSNELDQLFELERDNPEPPVLVKRRVRAGVMTVASLPTPSSHGSPAGVPAPGSRSILGSSTLAGAVAKVAVIFGLGAASGAGMQAYIAGGRVDSNVPVERNEPEEPPALQNDSREPPPPAQEAVSPKPSTRHPETVGARPAPTRESVPAEGPAERHEPQRRGRDIDLAAERSLLQRARMAVARGDPTAALAALKQHRDDYPEGALAEEREALTITVLVRDGRAKEAQLRAVEFHQKYPRSMLRKVVDTAIDDAPSP